MDISNLTYNELKNLENEIKEGKKELERTQYKSFVKGVLDAIDILTEAGYGDIVACYDDEGEPYSWEELSFIIRLEKSRREEDY